MTAIQILPIVLSRNIMRKSPGGIKNAQIPEAEMLNLENVIAEVKSGGKTSP